MRGKDYNLNREDKLVFRKELKNFIKKETNEILFIMSIKAKNDIWSHDNGPSISLRMTFRSSKERTVKHLYVKNELRNQKSEILFDWVKIGLIYLCLCLEKKSQ